MDEEAEDLTGWIPAGQISLSLLREFYCHVTLNI